MATAHCKRSLVSLIIVAVGLAFSALAHAAPIADSAILLIGDGMGPVQIELAREAKGAGPLTLETMPFSGLATTRSADAAVTDSAAAGTALATGHKTKNGMISVSSDKRCLATILERCQAMYKSTGILSTDSLDGATPATFAAHVESRGMSAEIALQLSNSRVPVMLGFGKGWFLPKSAGGDRTDGRDLVAKLRWAGYAVVFDREQLAETGAARVVGLFDDGPRAPTLADMTKAALARLSTDRDGFFMIVEGARIDWKCHDNDPAGAVLDTWEFNQAVAAALDHARRRGRTLVIVTADHETGGLSIEDPSRIHLLGRATLSSEALAEELNSDRTNIAEVLSTHGGVYDLTPSEIAKIKRAKNPSAAIAALLSKRAGVKWSTGGHTATPVKVFAFGPGADRFAGEMDNTDIPKRIADVLGIERFPL